MLSHFSATKFLASAPVMITKTHNGDLGLGLSEKKKKKKKKVVKDPETQCSVLDSSNYLSALLPSRSPSPTKSGARAQGLETPLTKKKKKKKGQGGVLCGEPLTPELLGRRTKAPSPKAPSPRRVELASGEKKKKRKSLWSLAISPDSRAKATDARQSEELCSKKLKKHKKKKSPASDVYVGRDTWLCEAGDAVYTVPGVAGDESMVWGQKRKQGSPRGSSKLKRKKKGAAGLDGEPGPGHSRRSRALDGTPRKGSKKKLARVETSESIPIGDGPKVLTKKKMKKTKEKFELAGLEELAEKRKKKKKRKESTVIEEPQQEGEDPDLQDPDPDLEVVSEKKGNMDEMHIDQVRRKALQEEIDRESGKTETSDSSQYHWQETRFSQWDTAEFDTDEKRLKFFKLMGGLKNLSPSFNRARNVMGRTNMAMNRRAAESLHRHLQQDYDRALGWGSRRGVGLGYSPPAKVFYIDRHGSRSIKFED